MIKFFLATLLFTVTGYAAPMVMIYESSNPAYLGEVRVTVNNKVVTGISMYRPIDSAVVQFDLSKPNICYSAGTNVACALFEKDEEFPFGLFAWIQSRN